MDLIVEETECFVGANKADILARDLNTDTLVVIENQLECADHSHLGQIIAYVGGVGAQSAIWIASQFNEEHIATLTWLNGLNEQFQIFGIEIELWKIGDSLPAPTFNVIVTPTIKTRRAKRAKPKEIVLDGLAEEVEAKITEWVGNGKKTVTLEEASNLTGRTKRKLANAIARGSLQTSPRNKELILVSSLAEWLKNTPPPAVKTERDTTPLLHVVSGDEQHKSRALAVYQSLNA